MCSASVFVLQNALRIRLACIFARVVSWVSSENPRGGWQGKMLKGHTPRAVVFHSFLLYVKRVAHG